MPPSAWPISRDGGETFQRLGDGPVLPYSPDEPFLLGSPRIRKFDGRWQLWYVAGKEWRMTDGKPEPMYKIRMATSDNGIDWVKHGPRSDRRTSWASMNARPART